MDVSNWAHDHTIHKIIAGSHLYGTNTKDSDVDTRGVCLMPPWALLGTQNFEQYQCMNDIQDIEIYGLTKFIKLALDANPNILDIAFAPPEFWLVRNRVWKRIYEDRAMFLSAKVRHTFSGYAHSQLKRLKTHREWLINPPDHRPLPEEYDCQLVTDSKGGQTITSILNENKSKYNAACLHWEQYQTWLNNRNPERAKLEKAYGYDTKHAAHLVRLLIKAQSILGTCDYNPVLTHSDLDIVLEVKEGNWDYDKLIAWATGMDTKVQEMPSDLPKFPNRRLAERHLMEANYKTVMEEYDVNSI